MNQQVILNWDCLLSPQERQSLGNLVQATWKCQYQPEALCLQFCFGVGCFSCATVFSCYQGLKIRRCVQSYLMTSVNEWEVSYSSVGVFTEGKEQTQRQLEWSNTFAASSILTYLEIIYSNLPIP